MAVMDETTQRITALEERIEGLEADIGRLMMILRGDIVEALAVSLDDTHALIGVLSHHVPSLTDALRRVQEMNDSARSALRASQVFEWESPTEEELGKD